MNSNNNVLEMINPLFSMLDQQFALVHVQLDKSCGSHNLSQTFGYRDQTQCDARRNSPTVFFWHAVWGVARALPIMHLTCRKRLLELVSEKLPFVCFIRPFFRAPLPTICGPKGNFRQEWDNIMIKLRDRGGGRWQLKLMMRETGKVESSAKERERERKEKVRRNRLAHD